MRRREAIALLAGGAAWPLIVRAQQTGGLHRIGVLGAGYNTAGAPTWIAFEQALRQLGYIEGSSIIFERRFGEGQHERLPALAAELVSMNVDVIVVLGPTPVPAAKTATSTIRSERVSSPAHQVSLQKSHIGQQHRPIRTHSPDG